MTFTRKNTLSKLTLLAAGSLTLLAMTGCAPSSNTPDVTKTPAPASSSSSAGKASSHLDVSANLKPASDWTVIRESDRTKSDGTKIHNIRWNTGSKLLTVADIRSLFDENGYTVGQCFEQIGNCTGTAPIDGGTVKVDMTATAFSNSQTQKLDHNELSFETSMK